MKTVSLVLAAALFSPAAVQAEDFALKRLNESRRHHEWVDVKAGGRKVRSFVVYPEKKEAATALIVIHENRGLTDWVRSFADQAAEAGYLAIAPDLLSGFSKEIANTSAFPTSDAAREAIYKLPAKQVISDLRAVRNFIAKDPASNGKVAVAGFCWGGAQAFLLATREKALAAVLTFYGSPPGDARDYKRISAPVYGFYGEHDKRINAQIPEAESQMKKNGKFFEPVTYEGTGHAFMRNGDDPGSPPQEKVARDKAWTRVRAILDKI